MSGGCIDLTLDEALEALGAIPAPGKGERELWVNMAMALKSEFGDLAFDGWDGWSADGGEYDPAAARSVWRSLRGSGVGIGSLIAEAKRNGYEFKPGELSKEEKARRKAEAETRRQALIAQAEKDEASLQAWRERVAVFCQELAGRLSDSGVSPYLNAKRVRSFGLLFVEQSMVMVTWIEAQRLELITGKDAVSRFFDRLNSGEIDKAAISMRYLKKGTIALPMRDEYGKLWSLQLIFPSGKKSFPKFGRKAGLMHLLIDIEGQPEWLAIAEGYATAATVHRAAGWPAVVAFDNGNLLAVGQAMRQLYPDAGLVFCGDDDREAKGNPGRTKAEAAAAACAGVAALPEFKQEAPAA